MRNEEYLSPEQVLDKYKEYFTKSDFEKFVDMCVVAVRSKPHTEENAKEAQMMAYKIKR